ncbi:MAG TPA: ATP-binding protein [Candidatus Binatia bacterium]|nr:ATP-binding protein [Candidatus Binatia bacterium]
MSDASAIDGPVPYEWHTLEEPEHCVQFFEDDAFLECALAAYVGNGLSAGESCLVIASSKRCRQLEDMLAAQQVDITCAKREGQLLLLDAAQTLESLQIGGVLDRQRFLDIVGALIERGGEKVRVFGEMVALLWRDGRRSDALYLEQLWNELQSTHSFALYCAYSMSELGGADCLADLGHVCATHTRVLPSESFSVGPGSARMTSVVEWQHKATLLQQEICERTEAERALRAAQRELQLQVDDLRRLHETSASVSGSIDTGRAMQEVLQAALAVHGADMGLLSLCDQDRNGLTVEAHAGFSAAFLRESAWVSCGSGACGTSYAERRRVVVEDTDTDPLFAGFRGAARQAGFRSCHCTPLINRAGKIVGVLTVHFRGSRRPTDREIRLMDLYARMTADAIENARMHQRDKRELEERSQLLLREQRAREEAERASRLKDEFLATVSHELRTPLTAIIGWAHMLRHDSLDAATTARAVETIERAATAQAQLVEDILDVSRIITGRLHLQIAPVEMGPLVEAAVASVRLAAESKNLQLDVSLQACSRHVHGDANRLQQVVWNLLSNAIKFTPARGRVELRMEQDDTHVMLRVSDSGQGFDSDFAPYLFDRFRQADGSSTRRHGGLGLGLAIVRHLVELHGGSVVAESAGAGCGATFAVRLPLATTRAASAVASLADHERAAGKAIETMLPGVRVLLVDNDPDTLNMLATALRENGAKVRTAASAAEAFEVLQWYNPAVLISDLAMPEEDGFSFISRLRAREARGGRLIPAIALTAYARVEDRRRALLAGFNMFVPKPVEPGELIVTIAELTGPRQDP